VSVFSRITRPGVAASCKPTACVPEVTPMSSVKPLSRDH